MSGKRYSYDVNDLHRRYMAGESSVELAKVIGCHSASLRKMFERRGLAIRSASDSMLVRMAKTPIETRRKLSAAAHDAIRGAKRPASERIKTAATREANPPEMSRAEKACASALHSAGIAFTRQKASGIYNIDFALDHSIAVEVFGGRWHGSGRHAARFESRVKSLFEAGWHQVIVWAKKRDERCWATALDEIHALRHLTSRDPSCVRQYRVIWSDGELIHVRSAQDDDFPFKPTFRIGRDARGRYYRIRS